MTTLPRQDPGEVRAAFDGYRRTGDRAVRNWLIENHRALAAHVARRFGDRGEPFDDLVQVATLGLLKAVERFDPDRGAEFSTFAVATMEGELKRHFRDHTWAVHVPRRPQELHLRMRSVVAELSQSLGRPPSVAEVAQRLDVREEEILEAMEVGQAYRSTPIDTGPDDALASLLGRRLGVEDDGYELTEQRLLIERVLAAVPSREAEIIRLRFFEELTQSEIAGRVGISQMHVSRLLARTLATMREQLTAGQADDRVPAAADGAGAPCPPARLASPGHPRPAR